MDINLPAMGADPMHKDIFVEIDYMEEDSHSHKPMPSAIEIAVDSFDNAPVSNPDGTTGIRLHVDYGSDAPLWVNGVRGAGGATWGSLHGGNAIPHDGEDLDNNLMSNNSCDDTDHHWAVFRDIRVTNFDSNRSEIFHYNLWVHYMCYLIRNDRVVYPSGVGFIYGKEFMVSLGRHSTEGQQAGTFMHELGHNLDLRHGGPNDEASQNDDINYKPNYLSIMNYLFQFNGLWANGSDGHYDYSRYVSTLDENDLDETAGLNSQTGSLTHTKRWCPSTGWDSVPIGPQIDWNCDGDQSDSSVAVSINSDSIREELHAHNDWDHVRFGASARSLANYSTRAKTHILNLPQRELTLNEMWAQEYDITAPAIVIITPTTGTVVSEPGKEIDFYGLSLEPFGTPLGLTSDYAETCWHSDIDGALACGTDISVVPAAAPTLRRQQSKSGVIALTPGRHLITLSTTDSDGTVLLEDSITVYVYGTADKVANITLTNQAGELVGSSTVVVRETFTGTGTTIESLSDVVSIPTEGLVGGNITVRVIGTDGTELDTAGITLAGESSEVTVLSDSLIIRIHQIPLHVGLSSGQTTTNDSVVLSMLLILLTITIVYRGCAMRIKG